MFSAAWHHNQCPEAVAQGTFNQAEGEVCAALLLPEASTHRAEGRSCRELHFFCTLREASGSPHPQRGRPRWPAKNTSVRWKPESNEITSESFVLPKYLQCCCSADGWLFPFPTSYSF